jgi:hypothetical protein
MQEFVEQAMPVAVTLPDVAGTFSGALNKPPALGMTGVKKKQRDLLLL